MSTGDSVPTSSTTRATLLMRIRDPRDVRAWGEFDRIYRPLIARFARQKGLSESDADDVIQHCMKTVHEKVGAFDYDPSKSFRSWLRRVAQNFMINQRAKRHEVRASTGVYEAAASDDPGPDEEFERIWREEHLRHAYELLQAEVSPERFGAFHDHVRLQMSVEDTCRKWNISANNLYGIKFQLSRKLTDILRDLLGDEAAMAP